MRSRGNSYFLAFHETELTERLFTMILGVKHAQNLTNPLILDDPESAGKSMASA